MKKLLKFILKQMLFALCAATVAALADGVFGFGPATIFFLGWLSCLISAMIFWDVKINGL